MPAKHTHLALSTTLLLASSLVAAQTTTPAPEPPDTSFQAAMDYGAAAYKVARYDAAIAHFKAALAIDPDSAKASLFLGIAYNSEVVPNLDTPENLANAKSAIAALKAVPDTAPEYLTALRQIAAVHRNVQQDEDAIKAELHVLELEPSDPEAHYTIGVIEWKHSYANARDILAANNLVDDGVGNSTLPQSACLNLRSRNAPLVADGLGHLTRAIELRSGYDDAMQYLNLIYRRRADLACGNASEREEDLAKADEWTNKAMLARKQNEIKRDAVPQH